MGMKPCLSPSPHKGIDAIETYVAGASKIAGSDEVMKLSSNESPLGCSPKALAAAREVKGEGLSRYPNASAKPLRVALAKHHGIEAERIICGAGSDELFHLTGRAYLRPGDEVLYSEHGFLVYPIVARSVNAVPIAVPESNLCTDVDAILSAVTERTRVIFVANPNNPTGSYLNTEDICRLHQGLRSDILLVLDGAYAEYVQADDYDASITLAHSEGNVLVTHTFSKAYGLAGLRIGWGYAADNIVDALNKVRSPFNVSGVAQSAGIAALADEEFLQKAIEHNNKWLPWLIENINNAGFHALASVGNFLLVRVPRPLTVPEVDAFLQKKGIILRRMEAYGLHDCLRLSVGLERENRAVVEALGEIAAHPRESIAL